MKNQIECREASVADLDKISWQDSKGRKAYPLFIGATSETRRRLMPIMSTTGVRTERAKSKIRSDRSARKKE